MQEPLAQPTDALPSSLEVVKVSHLDDFSTNLRPQCQFQQSVLFLSVFFLRETGSLGGHDHVMYLSNHLEVPKIVKSKNKQTSNNNTWFTLAKFAKTSPFPSTSPFKFQATYTARSKGKKKALAASCAPPAFKAIQLPLLAITGEPLEPPEVLEPAPENSGGLLLGNGENTPQKR